MWTFSCCIKTPRIEGIELTDAEKAYTKKMVGLSDANTPLNEHYFLNMNNEQIKYLLSIVDMQDAQSSHRYATYVKRLHNLAILKKLIKVI